MEQRRRLRRRRKPVVAARYAIVQADLNCSERDCRYAQTRPPKPPILHRLLPDCPAAVDEQILPDNVC